MYLDEVDIDLPGLVRGAFHEILGEEWSDLDGQEFHRDEKVEKIHHENPENWEFVDVVLVLVLVFF